MILELTPSPRLRRRQAADRARSAQLLTAQALHPSRLGHVPISVRQDVAKQLRQAVTSLRTAEDTLRATT